MTNDIAAHNRVLDALEENIQRQFKLGNYSVISVEDADLLNIKTLTFIKDINFRLTCVFMYFEEASEAKKIGFKPQDIASHAFQKFHADGEQDEDRDEAQLEIFNMVFDDKVPVDQNGMYLNAFMSLGEPEKLARLFFDVHYSPTNGYDGLGKWEKFLTRVLKSSLDDDRYWADWIKNDEINESIYGALDDLEPDRQDEFRVFSERAMALIASGQLSPENLVNVTGLDSYFIQGLQYAMQNFSYVFQDSLPRIGDVESIAIRDRLLGSRQVEWIEENADDKVYIAGIIFGAMNEYPNDTQIETQIRQFLQSNLTPAETLQMFIGEFFCDIEMSDHYADLQKIADSLPVVSERTATPPVEFRTQETAPVIIQGTIKKNINFSDYRETEEVAPHSCTGDFETTQGDVFVTGEDGIIEKICQEYRISTFEADEILQAHRAFESATHNLRDKYSIYLLERTEEYLQQRERAKQKTGFFGKMSKAATLLPREVKAMWKEYEATRRTHRSLVRTIDTYELTKATSQRPESIITTVYNARNEAGDIPDAQNAMEGRRIFDTLRRQENLLDRLGI